MTTSAPIRREYDIPIVEPQRPTRALPAAEPARRIVVPIIVPKRVRVGR